MKQHQLQSRIGKMLTVLEEFAVSAVFPVEHMEISERDSGVWREFSGDFWGIDTEWQDFRFTLTLPEGFSGRAEMRVRTDMEGQWDATAPQFVAMVDGVHYQAFDTKHGTMLLTNQGKPGESWQIVLRGYAPQRKSGELPPRCIVELLQVDDPLRELIYDIRVPWEAACLCPEGERDREVTLETLSQALNLLDLREPGDEAFHKGVEAARQYLQEAYYTPRASLPAIATACCVGHTHIDVAWLWDLYQTRHKAVRTFSTVLRLVEEYPEFTFMSSQPVLYQFVKEDAPELYARIKEAIASGRWEPEGGMWLEADCNITSGESLVRQFLHGQRFFDKEFGKPSRVLWLPDVFGYSAALPQIMKGAGVDYFMTTKLSWSEFNMTPYDTFRWKGIDGTKVLTHFIPSRDTAPDDGEHMSYFTTYNAMLNPTQVRGGWQRFQQKEVDDAFLVSYGYGDGGGGPTDWMVENGRRMGVPLPGVPKVEMTHARPFFEALDKRVSDDPRLPVWSGELYLEYHRGTYTAMARNKRSNRKLELLLRETELWCTIAKERCGLPYPGEELYTLWQTVLTLQFHDILPGSSIEKVYEDSAKMYAEAEAGLRPLLETAQKALAGQVSGDLAVFNSLSYSRSDVLSFPLPKGVHALADAAGKLYPIQAENGMGHVYLEKLPAMSAVGFTYQKEAPAAENLLLTETDFETPFYCGKLEDGRIVSLIDKANGRELAKEGQALNRLTVYENRPHNYDAWDVNIYYKEKSWDLTADSTAVTEIGAVRGVLETVYTFHKSTVRQKMILYRDIRRIDFETVVDWQEEHGLLKARFPADIFYNEASYDIQYGNVKRATHKNTSWDVARFEVCAHKWADISEDGYGLSLLNDCKYGHSADENELTLTLLKSSTYPNPHADQEIHTFTYALLPHTEDWKGGETPRRAYELNIPLTALPASGNGSLPSYADCRDTNVLVEAVKGAVEGEGTILRCYEFYGRRTDTEIRLSGSYRITPVNLLEQPISEAFVADRLTLTLKPYQIASYLLER